MAKRLEIFLASSVALALWSGTVQAQASGSAPVLLPRARRQPNQRPLASGNHRHRAATRLGFAARPVSVIAVQARRCVRCRSRPLPTCRNWRPGLRSFAAAALFPISAVSER